MKPLEKALTDYCETLATMLTKMNPGVQDSIYHRLLYSGVMRSTVHNKRPKGFRKGRRNQCYMNASRVALRRDDVVYCEGFAVSEKLPIPLSHAWLLTMDGEVVDLTWDHGTASYFGIPVEGLVLADTLAQQGHYGLFDGPSAVARGLVTFDKLVSVRFMNQRFPLP